MLDNTEHLDLVLKSAFEMLKITSTNRRDAVNDLAKLIGVRNDGVVNIIFTRQSEMALQRAFKLLVRRIDEERTAQYHLLHLAYKDQEHMFDVAEAKQMTGDQFAAIMLRDIQEKE